MLGRMVRALRRGVSAVLPNAYPFNWAIAVSFFLRANRRLPRPVGTANATINDFIFDRMLRNRWSLLQQLCSDKQYAKLIVDAVPGLKVPRTVGVFRITGRSTRDDFARWLEPYLGQRLVAKPTHSSGKVLFLDKPLDERALDAFFAFSRRSYFRVARETQYAGLEKAILVEENVSPGGEADDYKFFCIGGRALYLQIDIGRYSGHRRAIFALPGFEKLAVISGGHEAPDHVEKPATLSRMIAAAEEISRPFDFVRVDLYSVGEVIYFGECTFSPGAGADHLSDEGWAIEVLQAVKSARRNG